MDARKLFYGDIVKNHNWILQFHGISSRNGDQYALYLDPDSPVSGVMAMLEDPSIMPVEITPEFLQQNNFEQFEGLEGRECWHHKGTGIILRKGRFIYWDLDIEVSDIDLRWDVQWIHQIQQAMRLIGNVDAALSLHV